MYKSSFIGILRNLPQNFTPNIICESASTEIPYIFDYTANYTDNNCWDITLNVGQDTTNAINTSTPIWGPFTFIITATNYAPAILTSSTYEGAFDIKMEQYVTRILNEKTNTGYVIKDTEARNNITTLDSNAVHKTGDETINGDKTFLGMIKGQEANFTNHAIDLGHNSKDYMDFYEYGGLWNFYKSRSNTNTLIAKVAELTSTTNDETLATTAWARTSGNGLVHTTSNETIGGAKTFTAQVTKTNNSTGADTIFVNKNTAITKGTAPSTNVESRWRLTDSSSGDSNSALIAGVVFQYTTSNTTSAFLQVGKPEAGSTSTSRVGIYYPATGDPYTEAPTPATSDNSSKIATTAFVNSHIQQVSALPASPLSNVLYVIPEE